MSNNQKLFGTWDRKAWDEQNQIEIIQSLTSMAINDSDKEEKPLKNNTASVIQSLSSMSLSDSDKEEKPLWSPDAASGRVELTEVMQNIIYKLIEIQEKWNYPSEEKVRELPDYPLGPSTEDFIKRFEHMTQMTALMIRHRVEFFKEVPGFEQLCMNDQLASLKGCTMDLVVLEGARKYSLETKSITLFRNHIYTYEHYEKAGLGKFADCMFSFCQKMASSKVDPVEYALISAILAFSEQTDYVQPNRIANIQLFYVQTLRAYLLNNHPRGENYFDYLHFTICELRTVTKKLIQCLRRSRQSDTLPSTCKEILDSTPT